MYLVNMGPSYSIRDWLKTIATFLATFSQQR